MSTLESVVRSDPEILGGTPVFAGTRVPIKNLIDYLAAVDSLGQFLDDFPSVSRQQAIAALAKDLLTSVRILLDKSPPRRLSRLLSNHDVRTATQMDWSRLGNGALLRVRSRITSQNWRPDSCHIRLRPIEQTGGIAGLLRGSAIEERPKMA